MVLRYFWLSEIIKIKFIYVINGYFSNGTDWYQVTGDVGQLTSSDPNGC
jgi:hypothetical protein